MTTRRTCKWCGAEYTSDRTKCHDCLRLERDYRSGCANIRKSSSATELCAFRNLLYDMLHNMPGAKDLPKDIHYQYERVSRYLSLKEK